MSISMATYTPYNAMFTSGGGPLLAVMNARIPTLKIISVMSAFDADVTTRIHVGNRDFESRYPLVWSEIKPCLVLSEKKSHRNNPRIKFSRYCGSFAKMNENTAINVTNIMEGLSSAQTNP